MWEQGNSQYGFNELVNMHLGMESVWSGGSGGGYTMAPIVQKSISSGNEGPKQAGGASQQANEMLREEVRGSTDQTGTIASKKDSRGQNGPPYPVGPVAGRLQERVKGSPAFGYTMEKEHLPMHDGVRTLIIVHYHSRGGKEAMPTPDDWAMIRQERAPMYFSSRELAKTGRYIILRQDGGRDVYIDPQLILPTH